MSHETPHSSDSEWDEWEVIHFQTESTTNEAKSKKAKEKDVENLAKEIRDQLSISQQEEKTKLEELNRKLNEQRQLSEAKLQQIASQLQSISKLQQMTHNNHQETNAKLQEANDKVCQIEKETKKATTAKTTATTTTTTTTATAAATATTSIGKYAIIVSINWYNLCAIFWFIAAVINTTTANSTNFATNNGSQFF